VTTPLRCAPQERGSARSPTATPTRRWGHIPSSGCTPILERRPARAGSRKSAESYRESLITPFDGLKPGGNRGLERAGKRNKKSRHGGVPGGSPPCRLTRQRAPRPSRVALYLVIRQLHFGFHRSRLCFRAGSMTTFILPRGKGKASEFFSDRVSLVTAAMPVGDP